MARHLAAIIALSGFAIILKEVINAIPGLPFQLPTLTVLAPLLLFYAVHVWVAYQLTCRTGAQLLFYHQLQGGLYLVLGLVCLLILISLPLLWWGVIQKLAAMAGNGGS